MRTTPEKWLSAISSSTRAANLSPRISADDTGVVFGRSGLTTDAVRAQTLRPPVGVPDGALHVADRDTGEFSPTTPNASGRCGSTEPTAPPSPGVRRVTDLATDRQ